MNNGGLSYTLHIGVVGGVGETEKCEYGCWWLVYNGIRKNQRATVFSIAFRLFFDCK